MSEKVFITKKAFAYTNQSIEHLIATVENLSNSKRLADVSELTDTHTRKHTRNKLKIQVALFGKRLKPFVFVSCLN